MGIIHSYYYMAYKENERIEKENKRVEKERQAQEAAKKKLGNNGSKRQVHPLQSTDATALSGALSALADEIDEGGL